MYNILKIEFKRAFINRAFFISLFIGILLAALQIMDTVLPYAFGFRLGANQYPPTIFNYCIGMFPNVWSSIFYIIFPILATLPFADSFLVDQKSGYVKNIYTRGKKGYYLISKFMAVFSSAGLVTIIPLGINIFFASLCVPAVIPDVSTGFFPIFANATWSSIYYTDPFMYLMLFQLLMLITSGVLACSALLFSFFVKSKYVINILPFLLFVSISILSQLITSDDSFNMMKWILPIQGNPLNLYAVGIELGIIALVSGVIYFWRGMRNEIF